MAMNRFRRAGIGVMVGTLAVAGIAIPGSAQSPAAATTPEEAVVAFDAAWTTPSDPPLKIAYIVECANENGYCLTRVKAMDDAAAKYGFTYQTFNSVFNPATQLTDVQDAVALGFDGYLFAPAAGEPGCQAWQQYIVPTGKPTVSLDIPMCGDADYSEGLAATVTMQSEEYFYQHITNAFKSCTEACQAAAIGGFTGSDLFGYWQAAIERALAENPNVSLVVNQPANFDPNMANKVISDGLVANPDISVVISSWDQMTLGAEAAITAAGKTPGTDVRIYSLGGSQDALTRIKEGTWTESTLLLPYEEGLYGSAALMMAIGGQPLNAYVNEANLAVVKDGPGTIFIDASNVDAFTPRY